MKGRGNKRGRVAAAITVVAWSVLGLVVPLSLSMAPGDLPSGAVVAASRDQVALTVPIAVDFLGVGLVAERGTLSLLNVTNSGENRVAERRLLSNGQGVLAADGVEFSLGRIAVPANASAVATDEPALLTALATSQFETMKLRRSTIIVAVAENRTERLTNVTMEVSRRRKALFGFKGTADIRGLPHAIEGSFGSGDKRAMSTPPLKISINGPLIKATFDGRASLAGKSALAGAMELVIATDAPSPLGLRALTNSLPAAHVASSEDVRIKGDADWAGDALAFDKATVQYRGQEAQGVLHVSFGQSRTKFSGTLAAKTLDIGQVLRGDQPTNIAIATLEHVASHVAAWVPSLSSASALSEVDADIRLSTGRFTGLPLEAGAAAVSVYLQSGKLNAAISEFNYAGGHATGQVAIDFSRPVPVASIRAKADGIDLATLTFATAGHAILQGPAAVAIDLKSEGLNADQIARSLEGQVTLSQKDWGRFGLDIKSLTALTQRNVVVGWPAMKGSTNFEQLDVKMTVRAGSATIDSFVMKQGDGIVSGQGGFGVGGVASSRLFVDLVTTLANPFGQPALAPGAADAGSDALEIRGTFATPEARRKVAPRSADPVTTPAVSANRVPG